MIKSKLRPCPWCGNDADYTLLKLSSVHVSCDSCGSQGPTANSATAAKKAWNDRIGSDINEQIGCLYEIRCILGDKAGKLMQSEVIDRVREMADHFRAATKKGKRRESAKGEK
jgi:Lar family restriction alleviation protein